MSSPDIAVEPKPIPPEIDRWNWGAFFLSWIWGIGNATPIALLTLVPLVGFVMLFVLGARGSRWAWRNKRWDSVEHFKRVQRKWAICGPDHLDRRIRILGGDFLRHVFDSAALGSLPDRRRKASNEPGGNQRARHADRGWQNRPARSRPPDDSGKASLTFPVSGPKASGTAFVEAIKKNGVWTHHPARVQARWQRQRDRHHRRRALKLDVSRAVTPH